MKEKELKDQIQFWFSKWCNAIMVDEKKIYFNLYNNYQNLYDYLKQHNELI